MLERGVHVLQAFRPAGGTLSLTELMRRTGMPKATVYRLVVELVDLGLLERASHGYRPGLALFELGELAVPREGLRDIALPFMQDLYEATHQTVHLGIRDGLDVVYAEKIRGHRSVDVPSRVGGRLPLSSTGVGKALLAFAPTDATEAVLNRPLRCLTPYSISDAPTLRKQLAEIRRVGLAHETSEAAIGVQCIAAPVLVNGEAMAALSIAMLNDDDAMHFAPALRAVARAFSRRL
jgi:DNA-binding IclR family transcriptional regulator